MDLVWIGPDRLDAIWPRVRKRLSRDPLRSVESPSAIYQWVMLAQADLWLAMDFEEHIYGVVIVAVASNTLCVHLATGTKLPTWIDEAARRLREFALARNLRRIRVYCRKGWVYFGKRLAAPEFGFTICRDIPLVEPVGTAGLGLPLNRQVPRDHFLASHLIARVG
jgi:hypothetical protein